MVEIQYKNANVKLGPEALVYEPAEDSFLLADVALKELGKSGEAEKLRKSGEFKENEGAEKFREWGKFKPEKRVLEVGAGSGFVSAVLRANNPAVRVLATEINPHAARCAKENGVEVIRTDMFKGLKSGGTDGLFDLILFNPPYLPTSEEERVSGWLNYAFDGGISGRETLDRFLDEVKKYLRPGGKVLLLISSITGVEEVEKKMEGLGFKVEIVGRKKVSFEELLVVRGRIL